MYVCAGAPRHELDSQLMPPGPVLVDPSRRHTLVVAPLAAAKPLRALSRHISTPNRVF
jgi:hypothetical protein